MRAFPARCIASRHRRQNDLPLATCPHSKHQKSVHQSQQSPANKAVQKHTNNSTLRPRRLRTKYNRDCGFRRFNVHGISWSSGRGTCFSDSTYGENGTAPKQPQYRCQSESSHYKKRSLHSRGDKRRFRSLIYIRLIKWSKHILADCY